MSVYSLFKLDTQSVQDAIKTAFYRVLKGKGELIYQKLALLAGDDITDRTIKAYAVEDKNPPLYKTILIVSALEEHQQGLGAVFLNEILSVVGYKVIPIGQSPEHKIADYLQLFADAVRDGTISDLRAENVKGRAE